MYFIQVIDYYDMNSGYVALTRKGKRNINQIV